MLVSGYHKADPAQALSAELAALRAAERAAFPEPAHESLLLWESDRPCVVLPRSGKAADSLRRPEEPRIPVLRRESGGGAVLLGPGCLSYALVLSLERRPELLDVEQSYAKLLSAVLHALALPGARAIGSDIVLRDRKFGGHAQRRTRRALLHHGTILYDFDLDRVSDALNEPARQPSYRRRRTHDRFLVNAPISLSNLLASFDGLAATLSRS